MPSTGGARNRRRSEAAPLPSSAATMTKGGFAPCCVTVPIARKGQIGFLQRAHCRGAIPIRSDQSSMTDGCVFGRSCQPGCPPQWGTSLWKTSVKHRVLPVDQSVPSYADYLCSANCWGGSRSSSWQIQPSNRWNGRTLACAAPVRPQRRDRLREHRQSAVKFCRAVTIDFCAVRSKTCRPRNSSDPSSRR